MYLCQFYCRDNINPLHFEAGLEDIVHSWDELCYHVLCSCSTSHIFSMIMSSLMMLHINFHLHSLM
jgi:hypothetical protein